MNEELSGLTIKDVQNGNFQKNVDYRGFTASPLLESLKELRFI